MAVHLAQIELALLFVLMLCLALLETVIPRVLALPAAALVAVQTAALHAMRTRSVSVADPPPEGLAGVPEVIAIVVVPVLGTALFAAVFWHLARANARVRRRTATPSAATSPQAGAPRPVPPPASPAARPATARRDLARPGG